MVLDVLLVSTQHYKVRVKSKVEQSRESSVVIIEKEAFGSPSTKVANFTLFTKVSDLHDKNDFPLKVFLL